MGKWIEALVVLGRADASPEASARTSRAASSEFDNRASILRCIPGEAREHLPPQLSVCCLPTGIQRKPFHHRSLSKYYDKYNVVLTDSTGNKTYGYCCTFFDVCSDRVPREGESQEDEFAYTKCLCLISKDPLYSTFETLVQTMYSTCFYQRSVLSYNYDLLAEIVTRVNLLPRELGSPMHLILPIDSRTIHLEFECLPEGSPSEIQIDDVVGIKPKALLCLFEAVLLERKVILRSESKAKLSGVAEALCELLYPMTWQHIYIPIVPQGLTEYLEAPTPYLMGVLSSISTHSLNYDQSIEINIDDSTCHFGEDFSLPFCDDFVLLRKRLEQLPREGGHLDRNRYLKHRERDIRSLFLEFVTNLLAEARKHFQQNKRDFGEVSGQDPDFLQSFMETQMFQNFFHNSPGMLDAQEFDAMRSRLTERFSLVSEAQAVGKQVEIVSFQSMLPSADIASDLEGAKKNSLANLSGAEGWRSKAEDKMYSKLQMEAIKSERIVDLHESGLQVTPDGGGNSSDFSYNEKIEELFDCVYLYFQTKYGNLLFDTSSSIVRQCIDSVGSMEHLTAMVDVFKYTIMESKSKTIEFHSLDTMQKLIPVFEDIVMKAIHSGDHILAFGVLAMSLFIEYKPVPDGGEGITAFAHVVNDFPKNKSFWVELVSSIVGGAQNLEAEESAAGYEFVADLLLLCSVIFGDDTWYEASVHDLAEKITMSELEAKDIKVMCLLSKSKFSPRAVSMCPDSNWNLLGKFQAAELREMEVRLPSGELKAAPNSPVKSMDSFSNVIIAATCDAQVRLYSKPSGGSKILRAPASVLRQRSRLNLVKFSREGSNFFIVSNRIGVWDTRSLKSIRHMEVEDTHSCFRVRKNNSGKDSILAGTAKGSCKLWDHLSSASAACLSFEGHSKQVTKITCLEGDNNLFVSSSRDGRALLWDVRKNGEPVHTMVGHESWITDHRIFYCGDDPYLVCGSDDWTSTVWNLSNGSLCCTYYGHTSPVCSLAVCSSDPEEGPVIASGDCTGSIQLWRATLGDVYTSGATLESLSLRTRGDPVLKVECQGSKPLIACHSSNTVASWELCGSEGDLSANCKAYLDLSLHFTACKVDYATNFVYSGCANGNVVAWSLAEGMCSL